jgi:hypothetical protein
MYQMLMTYTIKRIMVRFLTNYELRGMFKKEAAFWSVTENIFLATEEINKIIG